MELWLLGDEREVWERVIKVGVVSGLVTVLAGISSELGSVVAMEVRISKTLDGESVVDIG